MDVHRSDSIPTTRGPKDWFTGTVWMDRIVEAPRPARVRAVRVSFEPGARTAWHRHPLGQTLHVLLASAGSKAATVRCGPFAPVTRRGFRRARSTGTVLRPRPVWCTSRSTRPTRTDPPRCGSSRSPTRSTVRSRPIADWRLIARPVRDRAPRTGT